MAAKSCRFHQFRHAMTNEIDMAAQTVQFFRERERNRYLVHLLFDLVQAP
jgi:hypothetical protein